MSSLLDAVRIVKDPTIPTKGDEPDRRPEQFERFLRQQAREIRLRGDRDAGWLAERIERMADLARYLGATDGAGYDEREEVAERTRDRELLEARFAVPRN